MTWLPATSVNSANQGGGIGEEPIFVNMTLVRQISGDKGRGGSKLTFMDGQTIIVKESPAKIVATLNGTLEKSFNADQD